MKHTDCKMEVSPIWPRNGTTLAGLAAFWVGSYSDLTRTHLVAKNWKNTEKHTNMSTEDRWQKHHGITHSQHDHGSNDTSLGISQDWYLKHVDVELAWEEDHICIPGASKVGTDVM